MNQNPSTSESTGQIPICPECGEPARGTLEVVQGVALVDPDPETGKPVYAGETDIDWDSQQTVQRAGKPVWVCSCGHEWTANAVPE